MNKIAIITGANTGLGLHTARALFARGSYNIVLACRSEEKAQNAIKEILASKAEEKKAEYSRLEFLQLDLTKRESIEEFSKEFHKKYEQLDLLINNAGIMGHPYALTQEGVEVHFSSNHLGHFYLTNLLLDKLAENARIVIITSGYYKKCLQIPPIEELTSKEPIQKDFYAVSKLANVLHTVELGDRLKTSHPNVKVLAVRPGFIRGTDLGRHFNPIKRWLATPLIWIIAKNLDQGIETIVFCSTSNETALESGKLYYECKEEAFHSNVSKEKAEELWELSKELLQRHNQS